MNHSSTGQAHLLRESYQLIRALPCIKIIVND